jgi:hypothetical protein
MYILSDLICTYYKERVNLPLIKLTVKQRGLIKDVNSQLTSVMNIHLLCLKVAPDIFSKNQ